MKSLPTGAFSKSLIAEAKQEDDAKKALEQQKLQMQYQNTGQPPTP